MIDRDPFWSGSEILPPIPAVSPETPSALEKLGPSPFPKSGFPFLGFLATVYDHIATQVAGAVCGVHAQAEARVEEDAIPTPGVRRELPEPAVVPRTYQYIPR